MTKIYICEKPSQAQIFQKYIEENDVIITIPSISSYRFKFNKNLNFSELPFYGVSPSFNENIASFEDYPEGQYYFLPMHSSFYNKNEKYENKLFKNFYLEKTKNTESNHYKELKENIYTFLKGFNEIVYCCDADHTGTRAFDFYFKFFLNIHNIEEFSKSNNIKINAVKITAYDDKSLTKAIKSKNDFFTSDFFNQMRNYYSKKDYFEYNYSLNSILLFNKAYFMCKKTYPKHIITKNFIQVLFYLKKIYDEKGSNKIETEKVFFFMSRNYIGSAVSISYIIKKLCEIELCTETNNFIEINDSTIKFLSLLHKKINDPHINERIQNDLISLNFNEFKSKYDTYLKVVFGKQKRFLNKFS